MIVSIKDKNYSVKVCNSTKEKSEGMKNKKFIGFNGMFFLMGNGFHCFYMQDCIIPLDIIFIDEKFRITSIHHNCPPCKDDRCETYCAKGKYVLELQGGTCLNSNISIGDKCCLTFDLSK